MRLVVCRRVRPLVTGARSFEGALVTQAIRSAAVGLGVQGVARSLYHCVNDAGLAQFADVGEGSWTAVGRCLAGWQVCFEEGWDGWQFVVVIEDVCAGVHS
jgi:hypothetical protein